MSLDISSSHGRAVWLSYLYGAGVIKEEDLYPLFLATFSGKRRIRVHAMRYCEGMKESYPELWAACCTKERLLNSGDNT